MMCILLPAACQLCCSDSAYKLGSRASEHHNANGDSIDVTFATEFVIAVSALLPPD